MRPSVLLAVFLLFVVSARAEDDLPTAADVTEPGRSLDRALQVVLHGGPRPAGPRTVVVLLDPTPSLKAAGFADAFERAVAGLDASFDALRIGIAVAGAKKVVRLKPTTDHAAAVGVVRELLEAPTRAYRNVTAALRDAASSAFAGRSGVRELLLVTLENGDVEDDLAGTAKVLRAARVRLHCIAQEAFLADTYWVSAERGAPAGLSFGTGDAAYVALPWGWMFQQSIANEFTPSGYGPYALGRLAAAREGRVFLYAPPTSGHTCSHYGGCPACSGDHLPTDEAFRPQRLRALAPWVAPRRDVAKALARDDHARLLLQAWERASKAGLVRSRPAVRLAGGRVRPERRQQGRWADLMGSGLSFGREASKAEKLRKVCEKEIEWLTGEIGRLAPEAGSTRHRAMADLTLAMLHVTRTNLVAYEAWCREVAPALLGKEEHVVEPPEVAPVVDGRRVIGISYSNLCLCHGVKPFLEMRLPGGKAWDEALQALDAFYTAYMRRWAHTPFAMALRRQSLARFQFTYRGTATPPPTPPRSGSETEKPTTETSRPDRAGSPSSGGGSGAPTTGGG